MEKENKQHEQHEWDGITENLTPDPMWLRVLFYMTLYFALGYWILYPSWPAPDSHGILNWSSAKEVKEEIEAIKKMSSQYEDEFNKASFEEIMKDKKLLHFAMANGKATFQDNCAPCHGAGGGGNPGYPNLTAGAWMWGGTIDDIYTTIQYGIRNSNPNSRDSQMPAFGHDKTLTPEQVSIMAHYVRYISGNSDGKDIDINAAEKLFSSDCASCHGPDGKGNHIIGAPDLTDAVWLYGSSYDDVYDVIYHGRGGVMPYWEGKLSNTAIRSVAIYVHQLGGGK